MIDFKKRCMLDGDGYDVIRYGVSAAESNEIDGGHYWRDVEFSHYAALSRNGRRPGSGVPVSRHFFNKRIMTDDERIAGYPSLRGANHRDGEQAHDEGGSLQGAGQVAFPSTVAGSGAGGAAADHEATEGESESKTEEGNQEEVT